MNVHECYCHSIINIDHICNGNAYVQSPVTQINNESIYFNNNKYITQNQPTNAYNILITVIVNGHGACMFDANFYCVKGHG